MNVYLERSGVERLAPYGLDRECCYRGVIVDFPHVSAEYRILSSIA